MNESTRLTQEDQQRKFFDGFADAYIQTYHTTPVQMAQDRVFLDYVNSHGFESPNVLEIGCGTGNLARLLRPEHVASYTGIDLSKEMLNHARTVCPWGTFEVGSILDLPYPDETFEIVIVAGTLHHIHDNNLKQAAKEIARVMRTHGHCYGREPLNCLHQLSNASPEISFALMSIYHWAHIKTHSMVPKEPPMEGFHTAYDPNEFFRLFSTSELKIVDLRFMFPISAFFQQVGLGSKVSQDQILDSICAIAREADQELERLNDYGNEFFFKAIKHYYDDLDAERALSVINKKHIEQSENSEILVTLKKLIARLRAIFR